MHTIDDGAPEATHDLHFRPITGHARWILRLFVLAIIVNVANIFAELHQNAVIDSDWTVAQLERTDTYVSITGLAQAAVYIALAVLFLLWVRRAYRNLSALGATHRRWTSKWSVLGWFIPILNLWRPKQVINDIWRATDPDAPELQGAGWREAAVPGFLLVWWLCYIASDRLAFAAIRTSLTNAFGPPQPEPLEALKFENVLFAWSDGVDIVAALLAMIVVHAITARHDARADRLGVVDPRAATPAPAAVEA